jgi:cation diffusion facilitator family transporter
MQGSHDAARHAAIRRVLWVTFFLNVLVAGSKLSYGYWTSTLGLVADGYHSILDGTSNIVGLIGVTIGAAVPDKEHPYGHRKFEVLSAMMISMFIFYSAYSVLSEGWGRVFPAAGAAPSSPHVDAGSFAIALGTLAVNLFVARYELRRGFELGSPFLIADSAHTWSDVVVTCAVLVGLAATRFVHPSADVVLAFVVGLFLLRTGYQVLMTSANVIADRVVFEVEEIEQVVRNVEGIRGCLRIRTRGAKEHAFLDMVILVDPQATVAQAHELADRLEEKLAAAFPGLQDIVIHIEPDDGAPSRASSSDIGKAAEPKARSA